MLKGFWRILRLVNVRRNRSTFGGLCVRGFLTTVTHLCSKVDDPLRFWGVQFRVYRTICSFMEPKCGYCRHFGGRAWAPMVACVVFGQHLHTCVPKLVIRCGFEVADVACIVRFARSWSKLWNSRHFWVAGEHRAAKARIPVSKASCPEVGASLVSLVFEFSNNHLPNFSGPESQAQAGQPEQSWRPS